MVKERELCSCGRLCAKNYTNKKTGKQYYRKKCYRCLQKDKTLTIKDWELSGYIKKDYCEKCSFKSIFPEQITVIKNKGLLSNYKSVCLNCNVVIENNGWVTGDLTPDF